MSGYRVEKQDYSAGAWRVLDATTGEQVWRREMFDHPFMGVIPLDGPVCFDRKRDALAWVASEEIRIDAGMTENHLAGDHDMLPPIDGCSRCQNPDEDDR